MHFVSRVSRLLSTGQSTTLSPTPCSDIYGPARREVPQRPVSFAHLAIAINADEKGVGSFPSARDRQRGSDLCNECNQQGHFNIFA